MSATNPLLDVLTHEGVLVNVYKALRALSSAVKHSAGVAWVDAIHHEGIQYQHKHNGMPRNLRVEFSGTIGLFTLMTKT